METSAKNPRVSRSRTATIPTVIRVEIAAHRKRIRTMTCSFRLRCLLNERAAGPEVAGPAASCASLMEWPDSA
jgi:hypothetical protein